MGVPVKTATVIVSKPGREANASESRTKVAPTGIGVLAKIKKASPDVFLVLTVIIGITLALVFAIVTVLGLLSSVKFTVDAVSKKWYTLLLFVLMLGFHSNSRIVLDMINLSSSTRIQEHN